ncbi:MAG: hypothetical protein LUH40_02360 [Clostridiales bacterium]|nr:hypothetical protein [Clostridiales bacterium]
MNIIEMMKKAARGKMKVRVVDIDDIIYEGFASTYTKADDEENGIPSFAIDTDDKGGWVLFENEIKSIEII